MSQSPADGQATTDYRNAWISIRTMIKEEGASLSGREKNNVYLNLGDGSFADVSAISGADVIGDGRALAVTDWDDDGRVDLVLRNRTAPRLQLFHNRDAGTGHFLTLELEGVSCNRDAIGAHVVVEAGGRVMQRTLHAGSGFLSQSTKRLHFGLGEADRVTRITVRWPDGTTDEHEDLAANRRYALRQADPERRAIPARGSMDAATWEPAPVERDATGTVRLALIEKLPMKPVSVPGFDKPRRTVRSLRGSPVLLNIWSTTCAACRVELSEFSARRSELDELELTVVPMTVDSPEDYPEAARVLEGYGLVEHAGPADAAFLGVIRVLLERIGASGRELPLPSSLLLDSEGQLVAVYPGPVAVDDLLSDLRALRRMDPADLQDVRLVPGRKLVQRTRNLGHIARDLEEIGHDELARFYRRLARNR